jgi:hypothetical protein
MEATNKQKIQIREERINIWKERSKQKGLKAMSLIVIGQLQQEIESLK